ncbi:hypothetical protein KL949_004448 [Ogataea haglerorum]|nr:hypothetical protein KL915_003898 [Ogataea haglerorum]KAG7703762.1 hypothetical protein KL950_004559 [Ogataea haglerorum]KAG7714392.1 hypothetical protein KL913_004589 [Ogataea haglerorum]KAG7715055.1 hypothetical protein KL949_004448 [Ogataea haglerorum]KAG7735682.1 hypothetical protein KL932_004346 [Ogataea haglerorum]
MFSRLPCLRGIRWFGNFRPLRNIDSFVLQRSLAPKLLAPTTNTVLFKCIVFDSNGKFKKIASDVKKAQLILKHDLLPRDLRKIDKGYDDIVPSILVRENSILLTILHIRALIKADSVVLFNYDQSFSSDQLISTLSQKLRNQADDSLPYEIRALEAIFMNVIDNLNSEMKVHVTVVNGILKELESDVDMTKLKYLLLVSKKLQQFQQKATLIRDLIDEMLAHDDELVELYLTDKKLGHKRTALEHEEVEMLLESYSLHCDAIVQTVESSISNVRTTEEIINIILDSNRNQLMLLGLRFSICLLSFGSLLFIAGVYGMNLENIVEEKDYWFVIISTASLLISAVIFRKCTNRLNQLKRIQMSK